MRGLLIDTNVLSELRKGTRCHPKVVAWQSKAELNKAFVSVISMMELRHGILAAERRDPEFAAILKEWFEERVKITFARRVIPIDLTIAEAAAAIMSQRTRATADALIAATALTCDLQLVTRNVADFADTGVSLVNPWE